MSTIAYISMALMMASGSHKLDFNDVDEEL